MEMVMFSPCKSRGYNEYAPEIHKAAVLTKTIKLIELNVVKELTSCPLK